MGFIDSLNEATEASTKKAIAVKVDASVKAQIDAIVAEQRAAGKVSNANLVVGKMIEYALDAE